MPLFLLLSAATGGILLPSWLSLTLVMPILTVAQTSMAMMPVASVGGADFWPSDVMLIAVAFRMVANLAVAKLPTLHLSDIMPRGIILLVLVMLLAVGVAFTRYGAGVAGPQAIALARFSVTQIGAMALLVLSLRTEADIVKAMKALLWFGYFTAATIFISAAFHGFGETTGGDGYFRYQGLVGDTAKMLLLFFVFAEILLRRFLRAGLLSISLVATGGRFGFIGLVVGLAIILWRSKQGMRRSQRLLIIAIVACFIGGALWFDVGGLATRFSLGNSSEGFGVRAATWLTALRMIRQHFLFGFGYGAYSQFVGHYQVVYESFAPFASSAYSQVLAMGVDAGFAGILAFVFFLRSCLRRIKGAACTQNREVNALITAGYTYGLVMTIMSPMVLWLLPGSFVSYMFFIIVGVSSSSLRIQRARSMRHYAKFRTEQQHIGAVA